MNNSISRKKIASGPDVKIMPDFSPYILFPHGVEKLKINFLFSHTTLRKKLRCTTTYYVHYTEIGTRKFKMI